MAFGTYITYPREQRNDPETMGYPRRKDPIGLSITQGARCGEFGNFFYIAMLPNCQSPLSKTIPFLKWATTQLTAHYSPHHFLGGQYRCS
jgi:hypothetical protein